LQVGDILEDAGGRRFVVARILLEKDMPTLAGRAVDVLIHPGAAGAGVGREMESPWKKVTLFVEEKWQARHTGAYDPITAMPRLDDSVVPVGPFVTADIAAALLRAGYPVNLMELLTIKSDDPAGRTACRQALEEGGPVTAGTPVAAGRLHSVLIAAGFRVPLPAERSAASVATCPVCLASVQDIWSWSFGEIKKPYTTNSRTGRPEKDGLLCERIFGPERDWECACGKYRGWKYQDMICDRCGVKVTRSGVRRQRPGHIDLSRPVVHPWFVGQAAFLANILKMDRESLQRLVHYDAYRVLDPGRTAFRVGQLLHPDEHAEAARVDEQLTTETGAEVVRRLLGQSARPDLAALVLDCLPVLPAGLRPDVECEEPREKVISHTLTLQYQRVVQINNRLRWYIDQNAPEVIVRAESRALQRAVELLFGAPDRPGSRRRRLSRPAHNLAEELRDAACLLLEKTTDFSARGVVVPDVAIPGGSVGVPRLLAVTLFTPLLAAILHRSGVAPSLEDAQRLVEREPASAELDPVLAAALASRPVLVITPQAHIAVLQMVVAAGEAVRLHPDDGRRLGLSYGGEQIDLHLPLSAAAVRELRQPRPVAETASTLARLTPTRLLDAVLKGEALELTLLDQIALGLAGVLDGEPLLPGS
jgi:hypothetical protein